MENRVILPKVIRNNRWSVDCECLKCKINFRVKGREHSDGTKWLEGVCSRGHVYRNFDIDFIQPTNPFYNLLYTFDDGEYNKKKKITQQKEEQRKADLDKQYFEKYRKVQKSTMSILEKSIRKEVLNGD